MFVPVPTEAFSPIGQAALNFLTAGLGSLVAGYFGVWWGISKLRRERAFDRRLEWYQRTIETAHELANISVVAASLRHQGQRDQAQPMLKSIADLTMQFNKLSADAILFCTPQGYRDLQDIHALLNKAAVGFRPGSPDGAGDQAMLESARLLRVAGLMLAEEVRSHLGLEKLDAKRGAVPGAVPVRL